MVRRTAKGRALNYHRALKTPKKGKPFKAGLLSRFSLPSGVDLRSVDSPIFDQGQEGSCTANAACGLADFLEIKKGLASNPFINPQEYIKGSFEAASRAFVYWVERAFLGTQTQDSGAYLHTGAEVFTEKGAPSENDYPYGPDTLFGKPPSELFGEAWHHKATALEIQDGDLQSVYACLAQGYPVMFGFPVYQEFEDLNPSNYLLNEPSPFESELGGHANVWVGYDSEGNLWGRNSWGLGWGLNGYYKMSAAMAQNYCTDLWTFR